LGEGAKSFALCSRINLLIKSLLSLSTIILGALRGLPLGLFSFGGDLGADLGADLGEAGALRGLPTGLGFGAGPKGFVRGLPLPFFSFGTHLPPSPITLLGRLLLNPLGQRSLVSGLYLPRL